MEIEPLNPDMSQGQSYDPLDELAAELAGPIGIPQLDAVASEICRLLQENNAERERFNEAENAEIRRIRVRYAFLKEPLNEKNSRLEEMGKEVARRGEFGEKKKSRKVGFGQYGRRAKPEKLSVIDQEKAVDWLQASGHQNAIREKTTREVEVAMAKPIVLAHLKETGEIPPGFEHAEAREEPFIKPGE